MIAFFFVSSSAGFIFENYLAVSVDLLLDKNYYNVSRVDLPVISS